MCSADASVAGRKTLHRTVSANAIKHHFAVHRSRCARDMLLGGELIAILHAHLQIHMDELQQQQQRRIADAEKKSFAVPVVNPEKFYSVPANMSVAEQLLNNGDTVPPRRPPPRAESCVPMVLAAEEVRANNIGQRVGVG
eukprot:SAG11_NODE_3_length_39220_cov_67.005828_23_plen_140_part_00